MKKYEQLDISGDAGLKIWGETLEGLFANAAEGMSELITDVAEVEGTEEREVVLTADSNEDLLIQWLNELIFFFDTYDFIGKRFDISLKNNMLKAKISGGRHNPAINESRLLIKAATYHGLSLKRDNLQWEAVVIFDI